MRDAADEDFAIGLVADFGVGEFDVAGAVFDEMLLAEDFLLGFVVLVADEAVAAGFGRFRVAFYLKENHFGPNLLAPMGT